MQDTDHRAVAIVGLGAILPDAPDVATFWNNIRTGRSSISEVPPERWDAALYYDPDPAAPDRTYSKIGGWVRQWEWDPAGWRLPLTPKAAAAMDDGQKWAVACARAALADYGYPRRPLDGARTAVIFGNAMGGELHYLTALRIFFPEVARALEEAPSFEALPAQLRAEVLAEARGRLGRRLPPVTADSMPGELSNVIAGRVANLFDLRGPNFTVDAACASAMAALDAAIEGLIENDFDAALTGGIDRNMGVNAFVKFCKIGALSATGTRPFAAGADGFVMGEGAAVFLLKRLADAERDGDRIYAVVRGVGGASDGRGKGITAPNPAGQRLAIERAWRNAGLSPSTAGLIEAHGTSTRVGDVVELQSLTEAFDGARLAPGSVALGSVKSNFGHLKAAAGAAGLLKATLALHHGVLPPSLNFERPNPDLDFARSPFRVNTELRPWLARADGEPRRAGVSAFGFGGTNFHVVLEEHVPGRPGARRRSIAAGGGRAASPPPAAAARTPLRGALVLGAATVAALEKRLESVEREARAGRAPSPAAPPERELSAPERVAIDYGDAAELAERAARARTALRAGPTAWKALRAQGVFRGQGPAPKVAFLFTGQGSQYANMLRKLHAAVPLVAITFTEADRVMTPLLGRPLTDIIFVDGDLAHAEDELKQTVITQPAVLTTDLALARLLGAYGIVPDLVMGHSLGEYGALVAAGALPFDDALEAVSARGREMTQVSVADNGVMAAVLAPLAEVESILATIDGYVVVANVNSRTQSVIGGATAAVDDACRAFGRAGYATVRLPVSHAFHTDIVAAATEPLRAVLQRLRLASPSLPVVSNVTGELYPMAPASRPQIIDLLARQIASPVQFVKGLETLYAQGARVFVEVGPKRALEGLVDNVLGDRGDVVTLFTNHPKIDDVTAFNQALCGLYAAGLGTGEREAARPAPAVPVAAPEESVVVTGAALGLPGVERVFDDRNVARVLRGELFIDAVPLRFRKAMVDKHIVRLVKSEESGPRFAAIESTGDVIRLAARGGRLDLAEEFGIAADRVEAFDATTRLAIGAGIDALRDAGLPLVLSYKTTSKGTRIPDRWMLPEELRDDTGVIFASAFPGLDAFASELERFHSDRARRDRLALLSDLAQRLRAAGDGRGGVLEDVERRIREIEADIVADPCLFDRRFLFRVLSMGHAQLAALVGARGPNTQVNSACGSTTQAVALAEDWIRAGRCRRVVIVAADDATSDSLMEWIGAGFLATGAAATDDDVESAALPFDRRRHGMIVGMGAAALVVESAAAARERGLRPLVEVLAAETGNSAYHGTRLDVDHIAAVMEKLVAQAEARGGVTRVHMAREMLFMSHETYTPARGGSAAAEVQALRAVFGEDADRIVVANTKGFTGHPMGVGIEDVVAIKSLETGVVPPIPNFKEEDPDLGTLRLSRGGSYPVEYALRLGAGFGSQISMTLVRRLAPPDGARGVAGRLGYEYRIQDPAAWTAWLARVSGQKDAALEVVKRTLRVRAEEAVTAGAPVKGKAPAPVLGPAPAPAPAATPVLAPASAPATAVAATPTSAPAAAPAPPAALAIDPVQAKVLAIVAETTGYAVDMLDPELDLEADLGIDTVKQAETFAAIREAWRIPREENLRLRDFPTLSHVIRFVRDRLSLAQEAKPARPAAGDAGVPRRVPVPVVRPPLDLCKATGVAIGKASRVVVMPDRDGVCGALVERLRARGAEVLLLDPVSSAADVAARVAAFAAGPVDGVFWLPALHDEGDLAALDPGAWREALRVRLKLLYTTMRALPGAGFLVAATRLGGQHGYDDAGATAPLGGAVTGFTKAYKRERPEALVKAVDFGRDRAPDAIAELLLAEAERDPGAIEIGHRGGARWTVALVERPAADGRPGLTLGRDTVFLVTGGAGSIVAAIVADLAAASGGTFHLLDIAPEPDPADPDLARIAADREGLERAIFERLKARGERATPARVERELLVVERKQSALSALRAVRAAGGAAHYHRVDLRDSAQVARAVQAARDSSGRIDVVLHAAGLEISHDLPDKEPAELDLVFDVKVDGWLNLLRALGDAPVAATVAFSSVAGRFGNRGQTDYSAANDLLCKVTSSFRTTRPATRGIAIDWTAWADIGMAARGSIPKLMAAAGIDLLAPADGVPAIRRELTGGATRGEVVIAGRLGVLAEEIDATGGLDPARCAAPDWGPMIGRVVAMPVATGLTVETTLDPARQPFLHDHRIDGTPVLPGVMGIEAFAELAALVLPGWHIAGEEDVRFLAPFKFYRDEPRTLTLQAQIFAAGDGAVADCRLIGSRALPGQREPQRTVHLTGRVRLSPQAQPPVYKDVPAPGPEGRAARAADIYRCYFHGPSYQVMERAFRAGDATVGLAPASLPPDHAPAGRPLLIAPRLLELCFQTAGVRELGHSGRMALPARVAEVELCGDIATHGEGHVRSIVRERDGGFDAEVLDERGEVLARVAGYQTVAAPGALDDALIAPLRI